MNRYIIVIASLLLSLASYAQEWEVPADRNKRLSGFEFTDASVESGLSIYNLNCKLCHGDPGKANFQKLSPLPGDPATEKVQHNSDGALQFKISEGRGLMPSFKKVLSSDDIWNTISYIRSLNPAYEQQVAIVEKLSNVRWSDIRIVMESNGKHDSLEVMVSGLEGEEWTPVPSAEIIVSAKRYFGELTLDMPKITDAGGEAVFVLPHDLPGDKEGNVILTARLSDSDLFGEIKAEHELKFGSSTDLPSLTEERAMWNTNLMAPVWLLIVYPGVVLTVWTLIFFVLFQLRKIYRMGEKE